MANKEEGHAKLFANPLPASPYLQVGEDRILIRCGFSEQLAQLLGWIRGFEWHPELRSWSVPISAAETLREFLAEVLRLAEAMEEPGLRKPVPSSAEAQLSPEELFKAGARLLFGSDWQRETARALGRDETRLARFLLGERSLDDPDQLYADMVALMRRRAAGIADAAERFAAALEISTKPGPEPPDQGI